MIESSLHHGNRGNISLWKWNTWIVSVFDKNFNLFFVILLLALAMILMIYIFYVPVYWIKNLSDVGYNAIKSKSKNNQRNTINLARKLRKIGDRIPPPFPNGWYAIAESFEVASGQAIAVNCLGENFVVFRNGESGETFVLDAYCSHLGANLGEGGTVEGNCIQCPFHQWKFSGVDGTVVDIPYIEKVAKIKKWQSCEINKIIFVWYHTEDEKPWNIPVISQIDEKVWQFHGRNEFMINSHIQDIPENGADNAHLGVVHGPSILAGSDVRFSRSKLSIGSHVWSAKWNPNEDILEKHMATMTLNHSIIVGKLQMVNLDVHVKQIGPSYVQLFVNTTFGPMVILQMITPIEPFVQKVVHLFYAPRSLAWLTKFTFLGESIMFERDIMIWNHKTFTHCPILTKEDKQIKSFRNWYSQFYSKNSKSFKSAMIGDSLMEW
ncbi:unnamed protein product [Diamesa serratosioi]